MKFATFLKKHKYSVFRTTLGVQTEYCSGQILRDKINVRDDTANLLKLGRELKQKCLAMDIYILEDSREILIREGNDAMQTDVFIEDDSIS